VDFGATKRTCHSSSAAELFEFHGAIANQDLHDHEIATVKTYDVKWPGVADIVRNRCTLGIAVSAYAPRSRSSCAALNASGV
jgi:hypothetical protein